MKMNCGVSHSLVPDDDDYCVEQHLPAAPTVAVLAQPLRRGRPPARRTVPTVLMATAAGATLIGCASVGPKPWSVETVYRTNHTGQITSAQGYLALARQYEGERRFAQSIDAYRKAAAAAPDDPDVMNELGMALAQSAQFASSAVALRRAVALAPERAALLNNLGYALLLDGQHEPAREVLREALVRDPGHVLARRNLAHLEAAPTLASAAPVPAPTPLPQAASAETPMATALQTKPNVEALLTQREAGSQAVSLQPEGTTAPTATAATTATAAELPMVSAPASDAAAPSNASVAKVSPPTASAPIASVPLTARVEISNGNGVTNMAAWVKGWMQGHGVARSFRLTNMPRFDHATTVVEYRKGFGGAAQTVVDGLPGPAALAAEPADLGRSDVRVRLGHDIRSSIASCTATCPIYEASRLTLASATVKHR